MSQLTELKNRYRTVWIEHYEVIWSKFVQSSFFSLPPSDDEDPKLFVHELMSFSIFHFYNEQRESKRGLEAKLLAAEKKLADLQLSLDSPSNSTDNEHRHIKDDTTMEIIEIDDPKVDSCSSSDKARADPRCDNSKKEVDVEPVERVAKSTFNSAPLSIIHVPPVPSSSSSSPQTTLEMRRTNSSKSVATSIKKMTNKLINNTDSSETEDEGDEFQDSPSLLNQRAIIRKVDTISVNTTPHVSVHNISNVSNSNINLSPNSKHSSLSSKRMKENTPEKKQESQSHDLTNNRSSVTTAATIITKSSSSSGWITADEKPTKPNVKPSGTAGSLSRKRGQGKVERGSNISIGGGNKHDNSFQFRPPLSTIVPAKKPMKQSTITALFNNLQNPEPNWDCPQSDDTYFDEGEDDVPIIRSNDVKSTKIPKLEEPLSAIALPTPIPAPIIPNCDVTQDQKSPYQFTPVKEKTPPPPCEVICIDDNEITQYDSNQQNNSNNHGHDDEDHEMMSIFETSQPSPLQPLVAEKTAPSVIDCRSGPEISVGNDTLELVAGFHYRPQDGPSSPSFKYKPEKAVRKKDERAKLPAFVCHECKDYYEGRDLTEAELEKIINKCSKHRAKYVARPATPPDFWRTDFPSTEECIEKGYLRIQEADPTIDPKLRNRIA